MPKKAKGMKKRPTSFGEKLVYHRTEKGWTQSELATRAGLPKPTVNALEHGTRKGQKVAVEIAQKLARTLGISLDYLTGMYDEEDAGELVPTGLARAGYLDADQ